MTASAPCCASAIPRSPWSRATPIELRPTLNERADQRIAAIVSSLPLFNRSPANREKLLDQALDLLPPGGPFIQFSYALVPPIPDDPTRFTLERTNWVVMNLPPARVWCYRALDAS